MRWATRANCHVDRTACAWLIKRAIDPDAEFMFVDDPDEVPDDATPFDIRGVELSHHEADIGDEVYDAPEARGLDVLIRGLSMIKEDSELLEITGHVYEGLYEYLRRATVLGREPS
jgi:hypothetical protein